MQSFFQRSIFNCKEIKDKEKLHFQVTLDITVMLSHKELAEKFRVGPINGVQFSIISDHKMKISISQPKALLANMHASEDTLNQLKESDSVFRNTIVKTGLTLRDSEKIFTHYNKFLSDHGIRIYNHRTSSEIDHHRNDCVR